MTEKKKISKEAKIVLMYCNVLDKKIDLVISRLNTIQFNQSLHGTIISFDREAKDIIKDNNSVFKKMGKAIGMIAEYYKKW